MSRLVVLTPRETYEFTVGALACRQVPYIAGPPAIGKSQLVAQIAEDSNALMIDMRLSQMLSEDMTGIPERNPETGKAYYLPFDRFPLEGDKVPDGYDGWILFLDELSSTSEEVLAAAYSLILDRIVGGHKLHPKCLVVAAGNRASDSAIARELPDTLITRMLPIEMQVSTNDWLFWAKKKKGYENHAVVDFIDKNPTQLYVPLNKKDRQELESYPTPRGWEKVFAHIDAHERRSMTKNQQLPKTDQAGIPIDDDNPGLDPMDDLTFNLVASAVGPMAAKAFREHYDDNISLPFPWDVAQSPSSTRIPSSQIAKAKMINSLANYYVTTGTQAQDHLVTYVNRIGGEYAELFYTTVSEKMGTTPSDERHKERLQDRLGIGLLGGGKSKTSSSF